jgi:hypothetical protein
MGQVYPVSPPCLSWIAQQLRAQVCDGIGYGNVSPIEASGVNMQFLGKA